jgi:putative SOS response-associated peptidase YedK
MMRWGFPPPVIPWQQATQPLSHSCPQHRQPLLAGIWREWEGDRGTKAAPDVGRHPVFSFLTTDASPDVAPIHPDATPVLLLDDGARNVDGQEIP